MPSDQEFGELKAGMSYVVISVSDLTKKMDKIAEITETIVLNQATINEKIVAFVDYKASCEKDRNDFNKRITPLENWQANQAGRTSMLSTIVFSGGALVGALCAAGAWLFDKFEIIRNVQHH